MNSSEIFTLALGLAEPWYVSKVELIEGEQSKKELHLWLSFTRGYRFTFGTKEYTTYDTIDKTWRHLNFFEHLCYIHANVPRVQTEENKTIMVEVPWARKNSGFTLLFEAYSMLLQGSTLPLSYSKGFPTCSLSTEAPLSCAHGRGSSLMRSFLS